MGVAPVCAEESIACAGTTESAAGAVVVDARSIRLGDGRVLTPAGIASFSVLLPDAAAADAELARRLEQLAVASPMTFAATARDPDRYGRTPALLVAGDVLAQEILAREGLALAFAMDAPPLPCFERIVAAEAEARTAHRGGWKGLGVPDASPSALAGRIGRFALFEGLVLTVGNRANRSYLNFGRRWSEDVTAEIAEADREAFGGAQMLAALAGHRVRLRGFIEQRGGPWLALRSPMQLEVLDRANESPVKSP
jgi:hypothetical protein